MIQQIQFVHLTRFILVLISTISMQAREKLSEIAAFLKDNPKARLLIEGYCDWKGTPAYNKSLGDRRATTVKSYLSDLGADQSRIDTVSIGDESCNSQC